MPAIILLTLVFASGCSRIDRSEPVATVSDTSNANVGAIPVESDAKNDKVAAEEPNDLYAADEEIPCCIEGVKDISLKGIRRAWIGSDGHKYYLSKESEQDLLRRILPAAKKYYNLSYFAYHLKMTEAISGVNVTKTVNPSEGTETTTFKPGKGEHALYEAYMYRGSVLNTFDDHITDKSLGVDTADNRHPPGIADNYSVNISRIFSTIEKSSQIEAKKSIEKKKSMAHF